MTSQVNVNFPSDGVKVDKSVDRAQRLIIYNEISALQKRIALAGSEAFSPSVNQIAREEIHRHVVKQHSLARDIAFGRVSL